MNETQGINPPSDLPEIKVDNDLTPLEIASCCHELLTDFRKQYAARHPARTDAPPIPIRGHDVIHRALDYGVETCQGARHFMEIGQPWFAAAIVRAYFELVIRIMWSKTRTNGWQEIIGWWAEDTLKAADREAKDLGSDPLTSTARQGLGEQAKSSPKKKPNLETMLKKIAEQQGSSQAADHITQTYAQLFKGSLHQAAHANITFLALGWRGSDELRIGQALVRASCWLINSCDNYLGWAEPKTIAYIGSFLNRKRTEYVP
jgi:hypothetical protein